MLVVSWELGWMYLFPKLVQYWWYSIVHHPLPIFKFRWAPLWPYLVIYLVRITCRWSNIYGISYVCTPWYLPGKLQWSFPSRPQRAQALTISLEMGAISSFFAATYWISLCLYLSCGNSSNSFLMGCHGSKLHTWRLLIFQSLTASVAAQKKGS